MPNVSVHFHIYILVVLLQLQCVNWSPIKQLHDNMSTLTTYVECIWLHILNAIWRTAVMARNLAEGLMCTCVVDCTSSSMHEWWMRFFSQTCSGMQFWDVSLSHTYYTHNTWSWMKAYCKGGRHSRPSVMQYTIVCAVCWCPLYISYR